MELINTHCHSRYCGHGEGEIASYAASAFDAGLTTLAFTEHFPLSSAFDPDVYLSVPISSMDAYIEDVMKARADYPQMEVLLGAEFDYLGESEDRDEGTFDLDRFDLVLGSVHFIDGWAFDDPAQRDRWLEAGAVDAIWRRYVELWCAAASDTSKRFDVMSHPDLAKKFGYMPSFDLSESYQQMAEAARSGNRMVEVNTSGWYYACAEQFPALDLLKAFCAAGVACTVGTDAHDPCNIARDIERGYKIMRKAGYKNVTVPSFAGERRTIALD